MKGSLPGTSRGLSTAPEPGLSACGLLDRASFLDVLDRCGTDRSVFGRYRLDSAESVIVAALAYGEGRDIPRPGWVEAFGDAGSGPELKIARFARADWYAEIGLCLESIARSIHANLPSHHPSRDMGFRQNWHRLANSQLPEKALAVEAGLGFIGRNSLLVLDPRRAAAGPGVVLGLLFMPVDTDTARSALTGMVAQNLVPKDMDSVDDRASSMERSRPGSGCSSCRMCVDSCPTRAIRPDGGIRRELCLQHWSALPGDLPGPIQASWGERLYGCDLCLEACPFFHEPSPEPVPTRGLLGASLPAGFFLDSTDEEIRLRLAGTALGRGWMSVEAFRRNAALVRETARGVPGGGCASP